MADLSWVKQGRMVSPEGAPEWRRAHAGMVSVLPWVHGYRMFLTGRRAAEDPFQIGWLDLNRDLTIRQEPSGNPILPLGRMGCFDCTGMCMPTVVRVNDSMLYMYYAGWGVGGRGIFQNQCGLAISRDDGKSWRRWSEAPLEMCDRTDPIGVGTVFVLREDSQHWRMWYTTFREWRPIEDGKHRHYYHIRYAESDDGIRWRKPVDNVAIDFIDDECAIGRPMVVKEDGFYRMWFCTARVSLPYRIGYAESRNGVTWKRQPCNLTVSPEGWDSQMVEYAYVLKEPSRYLMIYNGNSFGATGTGSATAAR